MVKTHSCDVMRKCVWRIVNRKVGQIGINRSLSPPAKWLIIFCWAFLNNKCQFLFGWIWILHQIQKWRLFIHKWLSSFLINFCILLAAIISFFRLIFYIQTGLFEASVVDEDWLWIIKFLGFAEEFSLAKPYVFIKNEGGGVLTFFYSPLNAYYICKHLYSPTK